MITKPTMFVLGAGASIPYGFPSGFELRKQICDAASGYDTGLSRALESNFEIPTSKVVEFARTFMHSRVSSIDAFLGRRSEFSQVGKAAIAALLIPKEIDAQFDGDISDDWYSALWNALVFDVHELSELANNKVQIITFNYDRSLERYLHIAIMNTFSNVTEEEAFNALGYFNIKHVYGSLGEYGLSNSQDARSYNGKVNAHTLNIATKGIKVIPEARADESIFSEAREAFSWAEHVCFLGFGFDPLNMQRLGFVDIVKTFDDSVIPSKIVASTYGLKDAEVTIARNGLIGSVQFHGKSGTLMPEWSSLSKTNLETLREHAWILR